MIGIVNLWGGTTAIRGCMSICTQVEGCVGIEIFAPALRLGFNCALYSSICENPTRKGSEMYAWEGYDGALDDDGTCSEKYDGVWTPPQTDAPTEAPTYSPTD